MSFVASRVSNELEVENVALYTLGIPSGSAIVEQWLGPVKWAGVTRAGCQSAIVGGRDKGLSYDAESAIVGRRDGGLSYDAESAIVYR